MIRSTRHFYPHRWSRRWCNGRAWGSGRETLPRSPFENLRAFCEWWKSYRHGYACCLGATDEELEVEPELYQCDVCPVAEQLDGLWPENARAWDLFHRVVCRFTMETRSVGQVLLATLEDDADPLDTVERMQIMYEALVPERRDHGT